MRRTEPHSASLRALARTIPGATAGAVLALALTCGTGQAADPAGNAGQPGSALRELALMPQGRALLDLFADPAAGPVLAASPVVSDAAAPAASTAPSRMLGHRLQDGLDLLRARFVDLGAALRVLPEQLAACQARLLQMLPGSTILPLIAYLAAFVFGGIFVQRLFFRLAHGWRDHFDTADLSQLQQRAAILLERLLFGLLMVAAFAAGSMGVFLMFSWPPAIGSLILGYLTAFLLIRLVVTIGRFFLAPRAERLRLVQMDTPAAVFWQRCLVWLATVAVLGWQTVEVLASFGLSPAAADLLWHCMLVILFASCIVIVWRRPEPLPDITPSPRRTVLRVLASVGFVLVWLLLLAGAREVAWSLLLIAALPMVLRTLLRATGLVVSGHWRVPGEEAPAICVIAQRGVLAVVIVSWAYMLTNIWHIGLDEMAATDSAMTRLGRGAFEALVILLGADVAWQVVRVLIDRRLSTDTGPIDALDDVETRRRARLRTLLPVIRNFLFVFVIVMASLSALAAMGLQIGPLLAGAGVVGIGIGFGAQTLVRDILSGIFFLFDDAFRVGEFIESGGISGTVESFSLRSVRLRHYKGQLHTVPFGDLKSITNFSRDWVSEQMQVVVTYDTELDAVDEAIKAASAKLAANAVLAPSIIDPLTSMGVTSMVESGMQIGVSVKTRPGAQFAVRGAALSLLKTEFALRGIRFASWVVALPGGPRLPVPAPDATELQVPEPDAAELQVREPQATELQVPGRQVPGVQVPGVQVSARQAVAAPSTGMATPET